MTNLPTSGSSSFALLDERIRRWIWSRGWETLRESQERAIPHVLEGTRDVVISAPTSSGKTEAAFLPLLTRILASEERSVRLMYVSPLKALINDQFGRLELLCEALNVPVHRWHGDVGANRKRALLEQPSGVLLITPELLEALLMRLGPNARRVFPKLDAVVVDEVHAFIGNERGAQVRSLLHRLERLVGRRVQRIGLSATLSEPRLAAEFLRQGEGDAAAVVVERGGHGIKALVKAYPARKRSDLEREAAETDEGSLLSQMVDDVARACIGTHHLVFCNSKGKVEEFTDALTDWYESSGKRNVVCAHHGNLAKALREDAETRLCGAEPVTCVCTSTLEMGIDIGSMDGVIQIGPPPSVASLRQRVGRSGRRGGEARLRIFLEDCRPDEADKLEDAVL